MHLTASPSDSSERSAFDEVEAPVPHGPATSPHVPLDKLYRSHAARLLSFFARRAGREEARDLVQETFARIARLDEAARGNILKQEAYLGTVATNLLRDRARAAARRAVELHCHHDSGSFGGTTDPHQLLEDREALARLEKALAHLGPRRRRIFLLHRLEHLTYAEVAAETGMSVKGVKKQMAKALLELRRGVERG
jgi:RNA polymerase sigma-70 factor (ECF subfamily)